MSEKKKCIGYCLLSKEEVPLALTRDGHLVCFLGGAPGQTTEDGVLITIRVNVPSNVCGRIEKGGNFK